ncbi:hypothetical protein [Psychroflexus sp. MES1-P1E]|uniref:hypothetical protein n=1 Tax=Psychroflexus sp. MES1-P1E TaxID=2058320 RepID=UPI000C7BF3AA|nr:hypothetical protein [Psychroflexus sp. MES1-P1E]PKG42756.1 hypothetical protein CXF67_08585 [Psychroflexus sp. MES1-P1E]
MTNLNTSKEKIIKENRRIKLTTLDELKIKVSFKLENSVIIIDNVRINLTDFSELKRNPPLTYILTLGFLIYGGAITAGVGVIIGVFANSAAFWLTIPAAGMIYAGIKSPNFNKNYKIEKGLKFEIISMPD